MTRFDYLRSEIPLPDGWTGELRTSAFGGALTTLLIRGDGRLLVQEFEHRDIASAQKPPSDWGGALPSPGAVRSTTTRWRDLAFDGAFEFHSPGHVSRRYMARFVHGGLASITQRP